MKKKPKQLPLIANDPWLEPFSEALEGRHARVTDKIKELTANGGTLSDFASGHMYFGLHRTAKGWVFREWAPNATDIYLIGDFNDWKETPKYKLERKDFGNWEISLPASAMKHGDLYKMKVYWNGGCGERIPAWCRRVVQDDVTKIFSAQVWSPKKPYEFKIKDFRPKTDPLLIYECHIGMSQDNEKVGTYEEFRLNVLPRVVADGYNCIQVMAIQEHPYYGSFGYHVSSFFAPSSRFGTPDELKRLIDEAHSKGLAVIMDLVHSHAAKNECEGLGNLAGDPNQFFYSGDRHVHPAWDSLCFDYGKNEVIHFLLSNCKYWLTEFKFDGFRFDGVTSMLYYDHGLGKAFGSYADYYNGNEDDNAICYLSLANEVIHEVNPHAITIAEEVSGMPGLAYPVKKGGYGFDYRLSMNIPDYWIKTIKEKRDEDWKPSSLFWELTNRRQDEKCISYCESHDQALVGDKTIIFRLIDADMYWHFHRDYRNGNVDRGIALHKMIRLLTLSTINGGYLNFMGNEFGHPEWIDFPREGNGWSYKYARRQWHLVDDPKLRFEDLNNFDAKMINFVKENRILAGTPENLWVSQKDKVLIYKRRGKIFAFNFDTKRSYEGYHIPADAGKWRLEFSTDDKEFGGHGRCSAQTYDSFRWEDIMRKTGSAISSRSMSAGTKNGEK